MDVTEQLRAITRLAAPHDNLEQELTALEDVLFDGLERAFYGTAST